MDTLTISEAKEQLEELIARAARGEDVRISDPQHGTARLIVEPATSQPIPAPNACLAGGRVSLENSLMISLLQ